MANHTEPIHEMPTSEPVHNSRTPRVVQIWQTKPGRRAIIVAMSLILVATCIAVATVMFHSLANESSSYRDGFSAGGNVYTADSATQKGAQQACKAAEVKKSGVGGIPRHDNATQWLQGCVAAFNEAQSDN